MLSPLATRRVEERPQLGTLALGIPAMVGRAVREDALLGAALLLVAPGAADRGIEAVAVERLPQRLRLHDVGVDGAAVDDRADALAQAIRD